jgi:hypothetical protein
VNISRLAFIVAKPNFFPFCVLNSANQISYHSIATKSASQAHGWIPRVALVRWWVLLLAMGGRLPTSNYSSDSDGSARASIVVDIIGRGAAGAAVAAGEPGMPH